MRSSESVILIIWISFLCCCNASLSEFAFIYSITVWARNLIQIFTMVRFISLSSISPWPIQHRCILVCFSLHLRCMRRLTSGLHATTAICITSDDCQWSHHRSLDLDCCSGFLVHRKCYCGGWQLARLWCQIANVIVFDRRISACRPLAAQWSRWRGQFSLLLKPRAFNHALLAQRYRQCEFNIYDVITCRFFGIWIMQQSICSFLQPPLQWIHYMFMCLGHHGRFHVAWPRPAPCHC